MLIWEYRTVHRGTRNVHFPPGEYRGVGGGGDGNAVVPEGERDRQGEVQGGLRAMLYRTYHLQGSWRDINMGSTSFYDVAQQAAAHRDRDGHAAATQ